MSSTSCMLRMSWMSWPRLQPRRRLLVAATSAPRASFVPRPCSCCYTVPFLYTASFPLDCLFFCVGVCRREGPQRMQEGKEECRRPCSRTSVTGHFRAPVPETVANFLGLHGAPTLLLPVSALLFSCTARHANHLVQNYKATQLCAFA